MLSFLFGNGMMLLFENGSLSRTQPIVNSFTFFFILLSPTNTIVFFFFFWCIHTITILAFLVYVPQSKHAHLISAPVNVFVSKRVPGKLKTISFDMDEEMDEDETSFGVGKVEEFDSLQMLDFYS